MTIIIIKYNNVLLYDVTIKYNSIIVLLDGRGICTTTHIRSPFYFINV